MTGGKPKEKGVANGKAASSGWELRQGGSWRRSLGRARGAG